MDTHLRRDGRLRLNAEIRNDDTSPKRRSAIVRKSTILIVAAAVLLGVAAIPAGGASAIANGRLAFVATEAGTPQVVTINPDGSRQNPGDSPPRRCG
jgi:hypothetical protein